MKLIIFEGLDGSGKSTLIEQTKKILQQEGLKAITLQGLGSSSIGLSLRQIFLHHPSLTQLTRYLMSFTNMLQTQEEHIIPFVNENIIFLIDRWLGSNYAYRVYPYKVDPNYQIFNQMQQYFIIPNLTIYLDIQPQKGLERKTKQLNHQIDVIEKEPFNYFEEVRKGYFQYLTRPHEGQKLILDGEDELSSNLLKIIKKIQESKNHKEYSRMEKIL